MCDFITIALMGGSMLMQNKAAKVQKEAIDAQAEEAVETANFNAGQALTEKKQSDLQALQFQRNRMAMLDEDMSNNDAWYAFLGREQPSELIQMNKTKAYSEIASGDLMSLISGNQSIAQANMEIRRGTNAGIQAGYRKRGVQYASAGNMLSSMYNAYKVI